MPADDLRRAGHDTPAIPAERVRIDTRFKPIGPGRLGRPFSCRTMAPTISPSTETERLPFPPPSPRDLRIT